VEDDKCESILCSRILIWKWWWLTGSQVGELYFRQRRENKIILDLGKLISFNWVIVAKTTNEYADDSREHFLHQRVLPSPCFAVPVLRKDLLVYIFLIWIVLQTRNSKYAWRVNRLSLSKSRHFQTPDHEIGDSDTLQNKVDLQFALHMWKLCLYKFILFSHCKQTLVTFVQILHFIIWFFGSKSSPWRKNTKEAKVRMYLEDFVFH
jgi:hypothetical protein